MASCDDDFSLLGEDNSHHHHVHHLHQPYAPNRFTNKENLIHAPLPPATLSKEILNPSAIVRGNRSGGDEEDNDEDFNGATFCSQADPKFSSSFHDVAPFSGEDDANPFVDESSDPNKCRTNNVRNEKRKERDELSDGGTPYSSYRKSKMAGGSGGGGETSSGGDYRKDREEWSDTSISCLLDAYLEKFTQLNRGNLRGRDWEEVAVTVSERCDKQSKSVEQCKNKVDNLKKRYKLERHRMNNSGISGSHWPWFKKMEQIVGNSLPIKNAMDDEKSIVASLRQSKR